MIATHEEPEAHALETRAASPAMKRENSDHDGASPAIPIPKRRRTSDKSGPRSTAGRTTKSMGGASEDDINSLFWLVEVREPRLASRAPRSPARGNWIRRVQRVFFSSRKDTRGERSLEARSGRMGGVLPLLGPVAPPPLFVAAGESPLSRRKRGRSTNLRVSRRATAPPATTPPRFLFLRHHTRRGDGSVKLARGAFGRALCGGRDAIQTRVPVPTRAWRTCTPRHQAIARDRGAPTRVFPSPRPEIARGGVDPLCFTAPKGCV